MQSFFNYNTLNVSLVKSTRSIFIKLNRPESQNSLNMEMLFEFESLLAWLSNKVEIHSVFITAEDAKDGQKSLFSSGFNLDKLNRYNHNQVVKLTEKLAQLVHSMQNLPQTFVCDLREGASNIACELAIGADLRISSENCQLNFDHNKLGLVPSSSGMSTLALVVGQVHAKNFLLSGRNISVEHARNSGFIFETYNKAQRNECIQKLLVSINEQAPVQRIQTKLGIFDRERANYEQSMKVEKQISKASMMSEDWKRSKSVSVKESDKETNKDDFMPAKSMSYARKLTLVKAEQTNQGPESSH